MRDKIIVLVYILSFLALNSIAQKRFSPLSRTLWLKKKTHTISLNSISLSAGYYNPPMSYFNNTFLPSEKTADRFKGNILYGANLSVNLPLNLGTRVGAWYWAEKVSGLGSDAFNSLKVSLAGISLGAFYTYNNGFLGLKPYIGVDGSFLNIQDQYHANETVIKTSGSNFVLTPFVGINYEFNRNIVFGLEYGYFLGNYIQDMKTATSIVDVNVPVNGHKIQLTIGYKFQ